jgi:hypothetical protein
MSMHKIPLTLVEEAGLRAHGLHRGIGTPSQLADVFRQGVAWGQAAERKACTATSVGALVQERDKLRRLLNRLLEEVGEHDRNDGNAPGHCHQVPGVWDSDNGKKAGKPCAWCALWAEAKATILPPNAE